MATHTQRPGALRLARQALLLLLSSPSSSSWSWLWWSVCMLLSGGVWVCGCRPVPVVTDCFRGHMVFLINMAKEGLVDQHTPYLQVGGGGGQTGGTRRASQAGQVAEVGMLWSGLWLVSCCWCWSSEPELLLRAAHPGPLHAPAQRHALHGGRAAQAHEAR